MSLFVLTTEDLSKRPPLLTFAYSAKSQGNEKRRWDQIRRLGRLNLWLIFLLNLFLAIFTIAMCVFVTIYVGLKNMDAIWLLYVALIPLIGLIPSLIKLGNFIRGKGYTLEKERAEVSEIIGSGKHDMQPARGTKS